MRTENIPHPADEPVKTGTDPFNVHAAALPNEHSTCEWVDQHYARRLWAQLLRRRFPGRAMLHTVRNGALVYEMEYARPALLDRNGSRGRPRSRTRRHAGGLQRRRKAVA